jgi:hypothetical protein
MECVFPRNLIDSKMIRSYTIPRYGIEELSLFMLFHPWAGFPGIEYQLYGSGKARNRRRDQRQSIHSPFLDAAAFTGTDPARTWASSCQLRSGVSRSPRARDRGHPRCVFGGVDTEAARQIDLETRIGLLPPVENRSDRDANSRGTTEATLRFASKRSSTYKSLPRRSKPEHRSSG